MEAIEAERHPTFPPASKHVIGARQISLEKVLRNQQGWSGKNDGPRHLTRWDLNIYQALGSTLWLPRKKGHEPERAIKTKMATLSCFHLALGQEPAAAID